MIVLSDEIYGRLHYTNQHCSLSKVSMADYTIQINTVAYQRLVWQITLYKSTL